MYTIVQCLMRVTVDTVRLRTEVAMRKNSTSRREFLKQAAAGVTLAALAQDVLAGQSAASATGMPTRMLGQTGKPLRHVSFRSFSNPIAQVLHRRD